MVKKVYLRDQIREAHAKFKIMVDKYYGPDFWIYKVNILYTIYVYTVNDKTPVHKYIYSSI